MQRDGRESKIFVKLFVGPGQVLPDASNRRKDRRAFVRAQRRKWGHPRREGKQRNPWRAAGVVMFLMRAG